MKNNLATVETKWEKVEVYCNPCIACQDMIVMNANKMVTRVDGVEVYSPNPIVLCNECKSMIDNVIY
jgi:hypothetical protein